MEEAPIDSDGFVVFDSTLDLTMIGTTVLGGPVGFCYTIIDNTIGFATFLNL